MSQAHTVDILCPSLFNSHGDPTQLSSSWKRLHQVFTPKLLQLESMAQYVTRIWTLATKCQLPEPSDKIVDQNIKKCNSKKHKKRLLKEHKLTLEKLLENFIIIEAAEKESELVRNESKSVQINKSNKTDGSDYKTEEIKKLSISPKTYQKSRTVLSNHSLSPQHPDHH